MLLWSSRNRRNYPYRRAGKLDRFWLGTAGGAGISSAAENILNQESEQKKFELLNFGAPEFTTFHGLHQYQELVQNFQPDILIVGFGLYDSCPRVPEAERYAVMERYASILNDTTVISRLGTVQYRDEPY